MSQRIIALFTLLFVLCGCHTSPEPQSPESDMERVVEIFRGMPANSTDADEWPAAERAASRIAQYRSDAVRAAMVKYREHQTSHDGQLIRELNCEWKLYIVTKYLFELPEAVRRDSPYWRFFGGWFGGPLISGEIGKPEPTDTVQYRWPWVADQDGVWHLSSAGLVYSGEYRAMEAFDFYSEHFPAGPLLPYRQHAGVPRRTDGSRKKVHAKRGIPKQARPRDRGAGRLSRNLVALQDRNRPPDIGQADQTGY